MFGPCGRCSLLRLSGSLSLSQPQSSLQSVRCSRTQCTARNASRTRVTLRCNTSAAASSRVASSCSNCAATGFARAPLTCRAAGAHRRRDDVKCERRRAGIPLRCSLLCARVASRRLCSDPNYSRISVRKACRGRAEALRSFVALLCFCERLTGADAWIRRLVNRLESIACWSGSISNFLSFEWPYNCSSSPTRASFTRRRRRRVRTRRGATRRGATRLDDATRRSTDMRRARGLKPVECEADARSSCRAALSVTRSVVSSRRTHTY